MVNERYLLLLFNWEKCHGEVRGETSAFSVRERLMPPHERQRESEEQVAKKKKGKKKKEKKSRVGGVGKNSPR